MTRVPFSFDIDHDFVTVKGVVFLDGDDVVIETARTLLQLVPTGRRTFRIPADEIESIAVRTTRLGRSQLVVRPFTFSFLHEFPGDPDDEIVLPVARKHREAAEALAREARLRNLPR